MPNLMLSIIKFDWSLLFGFLGGMVVGISLLFLIYLIQVLVSFKKNSKIVKSDVTITKESMLERINMTKLAFKNANKKGYEGLNVCYRLTKKLIIDTASDFFPDSKHPLLELSIDEILMLLNYISKRIDELLDHKGLRMLRGLKASTILSLTETKGKVLDNPIIKTSKKYKIKSTLNSAKKVINLINPFWWAKKLVVNVSMNIVINKLALVIISIVGEEVYKVYSKKVFLEESNINSISEDEIKEIENEMEEGEDLNEE